MRVVRFSDVETVGWNQVAELSPQAWLFHRSEWVAIESEYFIRENLSFAIADKGEVVAIHPLYLSDVATGTGGEVLLHSAINRHAALALLPGLESGSIKSARSVAMRHIDGLSQQFDVDRIQLGIQNLAPKSLGPDRVEIPFWVTEYHFHLGLHYHQFGALPVPGMTTLAADQIVDLRHSADVLFARFDEACRRAIRKAQANGIRCMQRELDHAVNVYYELAQHRAQCTKEVLPPVEFYRALAQRLGREKARLFVAEHKGKPAAGLIVIADKGALSFFAGAAHHDYLQYRVNDFIHWSAIQWGAANGFHSYRLGPWFPEVPDHWAIAKVSRFKTKFGARQVPTVQASFYRRPQRYLQAGIAALTKAVEDLSARDTFLGQSGTR